METNTKDALVKEFLKEDLLNEGLKDLPKEETLKAQKEKRKPRSNYENLLTEIYNRLEQAQTPDEFDKFYEEKLKEYTQKHKIIDFLKGTAERLNLTLESDKDETITQEALFKITERKLEETENTLDTLKNKINEIAKGNLVGEIELPNLEKAEAQIRQTIEREIENLDLKGYDERIAKIEGEIEKVKTFKIEDLSKELNSSVNLGIDTWNLLLLSVLSPYCPKVLINGEEQRNAIHTALVGDISGGKSTTIKILSQLSPANEIFNDITRASFEGIATNDGIEEGVLDRLNNGTLIIPEFDKFKTMPILKEIMDNGSFKICKKGHEKKIDLNMNLVACANPKSDFFRENIKLREQIQHTEAVLSRFDVLIPISNSSKKIDYLIDEMVLFGGGQDNKHERHKATIYRLCKLMKRVSKVKISVEQQKRALEVVKFHSRELETRPLVLLRDVEHLCRFINTIAILNYCTTNPESVVGFVEATDDDIDFALKLWEYNIDLRKTIYERESRNIIDLKEKIRLSIVKNDRVNSKALCEDFVNKGLCSRRTFFRKLNELIQENEIQASGMRNRELNGTAGG